MSDCSDTCLQTYVTWLLSILYFVLFLFSIFFVILALCRKRWTLSTVVLALVPWPLLASSVNIFVNRDVYLLISIESQTATEILLGGAPGYLLVTEYMLIVMYWILLFHDARFAKHELFKTLALTYTIANILIYTLWGTIMILMYVFPEYIQSVLHPIESIYASVLEGAIALFYAIYGTLVTLRLRHLSKSSFYKKTSSRVTWMAVSTTVLFTSRTLVISITQWWVHNTIPTLILRLCFELFGTMLPSIIVMLVISGPFMWYFIRNRICIKCYNAKTAESQMKLVAEDDVYLDERSYQMWIDATDYIRKTMAEAYGEDFSHFQFYSLSDDGQFDSNYGTAGTPEDESIQ